MKKIVLFAAAGLMSLAACQENSGYTINGTVAGAADGEYVYLQAFKGRKTVVLDSAVVKGGKFQFAGNPDTIAVPKAVAYTNNDKNFSTMIFLEKGNLAVNLAEGNSTVSGSLSNEALSQFMEAYKSQNNEMSDIYHRYSSDKNLSKEQRDSLENVLNEKSEAQKSYLFDQMKANVANPFGSYLLTSMGLGMDVEKLSTLLAQVPEPYASTETMTRMKGYVENALKTVVGKKFIDFTMKTPEGKTVKLSEFIGKDKYVLIDFWASWCGPCRREMPTVVAAYKEFKSKGFGIVGVSLDQDADKWKQAIKDLNITWPQMSDLKGWQCEGASLYGVRSIPSTVLVDKEGTIVARDLRGEQLAEKLHELMK